MLGFGFALGVVGCGGSDGSDDVFEEGPVESVEEEVRDGTEGGGIGVVEIGECTGTLLGKHMLLTAAHCFNDDSSLDDTFFGIVNTTVSFAVTGRTWRCLSGGPTTSSGKCKEARRVWVRGLMRDEAVDDFAVVFTFTPGGEFNNVSTADGSSRIYTGTSLSSSQAYRFWGRGPFHFDGSGAGVMRFMDDSLNWRGSGHFITDASGVRPCMGDSGGPYYFPNSKSVFGVLSNSEASGECAKVGGKTAGARMTQRVADKINDFRDEEGLEPCKRMTNHPDHWTCD